MISLHYASQETRTNEEDIKEIEYSTFKELSNAVEMILADTDFKTVYVFTYTATDDKGRDWTIDTPVIVTSNRDEIMVHLDGCMNEFFNIKGMIEKSKHFHLQEYRSYEVAYSVAKDMKEGSSDLCYEPDEPNAVSD